MDDPRRIGAAASSDVIRLAVAYNDALDRCTQTGGANIDEVTAFFADDAVRIVVGPEGNSLVATQAGKPAIRDGFLRRAERLQQVVELRGIEICGDWVVCRHERRDTTYPGGVVDHNLRILLVKNGKIKQLIVLIDAEERARLCKTSRSSGHQCRREESLGPTQACRQRAGIRRGWWRGRRGRNYSSQGRSV